MHDGRNEAAERRDGKQTQDNSKKNHDDPRTARRPTLASSSNLVLATEQATPTKFTKRPEVPMPQIPPESNTLRAEIHHF